MAQVIPLAAWRDQFLTISKLTLQCRARTLKLSTAEALEFAEALFEAHSRNHPQKGGGLNCIPGKREITVVGRGFGPARVPRNDSLMTLGMDLVQSAIDEHAKEPAHA